MDDVFSLLGTFPLFGDGLFEPFHKIWLLCSDSRARGTSIHNSGVINLGLGR